jgi:hypothetical protein
MFVLFPLRRVFEKSMACVVFSDCVERGESQFSSMDAVGGR